MSGLNNMSDWEREVVPRLNRLAALLNEAPEFREQRINASQIDMNIPIMPFGYYQGQRIDTVPAETLVHAYNEHFLSDYPDCQEWVRINIINQ